MKRSSRWLAALVLLLPSESIRADEAPPQARPHPPSPHHVRVLGQSHVIVASNDLSGLGGNVPDLATTYDTTLFELHWVGKQAPFNGSGVTTNTIYPLTEGEASSTNDHYGVSVDLAKGIEAGFAWQLYAAGGNRSVGRVFGQELPWDNFDQQGSGVVQEHFSTDLHQAWLADRKGPLTYQATVGNLTGLPGLTQSALRRVRCGHARRVAAEVLDVPRAGRLSQGRAGSRLERY